MSYELTTELGLKKAVPGSNQPFETVEINNNWDAVDAAVIALQAQDSAMAGDIASIAAGNVTAIDGGTA